MKEYGNIVGTDMNSNWTFNENGDLNLVSNKDNMIQAIGNRLQTDLDSLSLFYNSYGSILKGFIGWNASQRTLDFMKIEIENRLIQDVRLKDFSVEVNYTEMGNVRVDIDMILDESEKVSSTIILDKEGVVENGN